MCTICGKAIDDHPGDGSCPSTITVTLVPPETTTLLALANGRIVPVDMPSATHAGYAAKRVAEELGLDPGLDWRLVEFGTHLPLIADEPVAPYSGLLFHLGLPVA